MMMLHERLRSPLYFTINFRVIDALKQYNIETQVFFFIYLRIKLMNNFHHILFNVLCMDFGAPRFV